jgi:hypothetical protein
MNADRVPKIPFNKYHVMFYAYMFCCMTIGTYMAWSYDMYHAPTQAYVMYYVYMLSFQSLFLHAMYRPFDD